MGNVQKCLFPLPEIVFPFVLLLQFHVLLLHFMLLLHLALCENVVLELGILLWNDVGDYSSF